MFSIHLNSLVQLLHQSQSEGRKLLQRKRIQCGQQSYNLCFVLDKGLLTIRKSKSIKTRRKSHRLTRKQRRSPAKNIRKDKCIGWCEMKDDETQTTSMQNPNKLAVKPRKSTFDVAIQTRPKVHHVSEDTFDLKLLIAREQQTILNTQATSTQTRLALLEQRSMQTEDQVTKATETQTEDVAKRAQITQTSSDKDKFNSSGTQTTMLQDAAELMHPHEKLLQLIVRGVNQHSGDLEELFKSIHILVDLKMLLIKKQNFDSLLQLKTQEEIKQQLAKRINRKHCCMYRCKFKAKANPSHGLKPKETQTKEAMRFHTQLTHTSSQTDGTDIKTRSKGFPWRKGIN